MIGLVSYEKEEIYVRDTWYSYKQTQDGIKIPKALNRFILLRAKWSLVHLKLHDFAKFLPNRHVFSPVIYVRTKSHFRRTHA